jgi:hypothetical protein
MPTLTSGNTNAQSDRQEVRGIRAGRSDDEKRSSCAAKPLKRNGTQGRVEPPTLRFSVEERPSLFNDLALERLEKTT